MSPPSNLSYAQPSISALVNQAIAADTPSVTGTVTSYAVSPALPAGLSLNGTTGIITGAPTTAAAKASYTVTASNSAGAATATVQIAVVTPLPPPTGLMYPQTTIDTWVGEALTPDIPASLGTITSYTISPALPPGLSIDPSTGVISGTPTAVAAKATYVVTGSNSGGSIQAKVSPTITVNATPIILLEADNQTLVEASQPTENTSTLQFANSSILSEDVSGVWVLRGYTTGDVLASGASGLGTAADLNTTGPAQTAGSTLAVGIVGGVQVLSSATGQLLGTVVSPDWILNPQGDGFASGADFWQLASDGSYIALVSQSSLSVFSPTGQLLCAKSGAYVGAGSAAFFAASGQVQVANGPAGANTVETIAVPGCASTVSSPYQGALAAWFNDGNRFITQAGGTVWVYSSSGALQATVQITIPPSAASAEFESPVLGGVGNWIWTFGRDGSTQETTVLSVYPVGSSTPALTEAAGLLGAYQASGTTLGVFPDSTTVSVIDLSGTAPVRTDYAVPSLPSHAIASEYPVSAFAAVSSNLWVATTEQIAPAISALNGPILDGASLPTSTPRYVGRGSVLSAAGSTENVALGTGNGQIAYFNPANATPLGSIDLTAGQVALSSDGSVLAASSQDSTLLNVYSLPSATLGDSLSYPETSTPGLLSNFTLSASGTTLGITLVSRAPTTNNAIYQPQVIPVSGSPVIWSGTATQNLIGSVLLSPDGTLAAVTEGTLPNSSVTIYQNGQLLSAVTGVGVGWIDNGRLLVNNYGYQGDSPVFTSCTIYSPSGSALSSPELPGLQSIQPVTADSVYSPRDNAIYSVTTGQPTWTSPYPPDSYDVQPGGGIGVVAGSYVVFESQGRVIAVPY